jgi:hypothetical protein
MVIKTKISGHTDQETNSLPNWSSSNFISNSFGQISSVLGIRPNTLIIGALKEKNIVDQVYEDVENILPDMLNDISNSQDGVEVDAIMDYQGELSVTLTKNPVQKKADVSDHRIPQPKSLTIELGVSNDVVSSFIGNTKKIVAGYASMLGFNLDDRRILTYKKFEQLLYEGEPFTIVTPHGEYTNMLLTRVRPHTDMETQGLFYGTLEFQELITFEGDEGTNTSPQSDIISEDTPLYKKIISYLF